MSAGAAAEGRAKRPAQAQQQVPTGDLAVQRAKRLKVAISKSAAAVSTDSVSTDSAAEEGGWQYEDMVQQLQGPFPLSSMQDWFAAGLLPLGTRVRRGGGSAPEPLFELRYAPEIAGSKAQEDKGASELTVEQWKVAGNAHMAADRPEEAIAAYSSALKRASVASPGASELVATLLSNRSGAHLVQDDAKAAKADALQCIEARPEWAKAYYRLGAALIACKDFAGALIAADKAEKLEPVPANTRSKYAALELLRKETAGMEAGAERERREQLLQRFRSPAGDTEIRRRRNGTATKFKSSSSQKGATRAAAEAHAHSPAAFMSVEGERISVPQSDVGRDYFWNQQFAAQSRAA